MIGIIGGSGLYEIADFNIREQLTLDTFFGSPSDVFAIGEFAGQEVAFLPRHSAKHEIPPHRVNYRANIEGFKQLGITQIIAVSAVGAINPTLRTGDLILLDQLIDFTKNRANTFYENSSVIHVDFTDPFCPVMRETMLEAAFDKGIKVCDGGTYLCVEGPRYETAAEVRYFGSIGVDVVGMTAMPEAVLAREREICYASLAVITNQAAGMGKDPLSTVEVAETMKRSTGSVKQLLATAIESLPKERKCFCKDALKKAGM